MEQSTRSFNVVKEEVVIPGQGSCAILRTWIWNPVERSWEIATRPSKFLIPGFISEEILSRPLPFNIIPSPPIRYSDLLFKMLQMLVDIIAEKSPNCLRSYS
ncbi:hypothetical protein RhiirA5_375759 [Rhizophagus irregularis]|uniref:Uncharacterized protein n=1 Tax=Rhizophagus irregularis TaxID=588596 RepID=A0A2I1DZV7_9GLOM|nr:hypothetical protein RhiirA5_375759 [Rhizophagus irregularis]PKC72523.1 hypothetical protein RhiirA1_389692 [Rhizophagus irregularis]PKY15412.1 hypothetical protein RhiirB3_380914 [Rhizophagus irregularis]